MYNTNRHNTPSERLLSAFSKILLSHNNNLHQTSSKFCFNKDTNNKKNTVKAKETCQKHVSNFIRIIGDKLSWQLCDGQSSTIPGQLIPSSITSCPERNDNRNQTPEHALVQHNLLVCETLVSARTISMQPPGDYYNFSVHALFFVSDNVAVQ